MKYFFQKAFAFGAAVMMLAATACTSDNDEPTPVQPGGENGTEASGRIVMKLNMERGIYDDEPATRSAEKWEKDDMLFITFYTNVGDEFETSQVVSGYGTAVYDGTSTWTLDYNGKLSENVSSTCSVVYVENAKAATAQVVTLNEASAIYEDKGGKYLFDGESMSITGSMTPKTGRMRFAGEDGEITVTGISHYATYDVTKGTYQLDPNPTVTLKVEKGYTPYVYGQFEDATEPRLVMLTEEYAFTRLIRTSMFQAGESGYMTIPTKDAHQGWQNNATYKVGGVEFTMIPVEKENGGYFMIAETEMTFQLANKINSSVTTTSTEYPYVGSYTNATTLITSLNEKLGLQFRFPTTAEWQFAYKGGLKSQNYTYAGSDNIDDVAWYKTNSGGTYHFVKSKLPNELGIYDMAGNAWEWVLKTSTTTEYYSYGGYYNSTLANCLYTSSSTSQSYTTLRLAY